MPDSSTTLDAVDSFKALPKDRQKALLGRMTPAQKQKLYGAIQARLTPPIPAPPNPILEQNPGKKVPFEEPKLVRQAASYIPSVAGTVGGLIGTPAGATLGSVAPIGGTIVGGATGGAAGAAAGGAAGKLAENELLDKIMGDTTPLGQGVGWESVKQAAYDLTGRATGAVLGRFARPLLEKIPGETPIIGKIAKAVTPERPTPLGTTIDGVHFPETVGQAAGKPGGFTRSIENYVGGTFLGEPFREVKEAQEKSARLVLAKLSKVNSPDLNVLAENWEHAREATRAAASPIYDALSNVETPEAASVAKAVLGNEEIARLLSPTARRALGNLEEKIQLSPELQSVINNQGYKDYSEMVSKLGPNTTNSVLRDVDPKFDPNAVAPVSLGDAIKARHAIGNIISNTEDRNTKRVLSQVYRDLDDSIDSSLTPEQLTLKKQADLDWTRSYIMEDIGKNLAKMESVQPSDEPRKIIPSAFLHMVNDLAKKNLTRDAEGNIVRKSSDLEILFKDPKDQKAMVNLSNFLAKKYARYGAGLGESIVRIGFVTEALRLPVEATSGEGIGHIAKTGYMLVGATQLSRVLAKPEGARLLQKYFNSSGAEATALAFRIATEGATEKLTSGNDELGTAETSNIGPQEGRNAGSASTGPATVSTGTTFGAGGHPTTHDFSISVYKQANPTATPAQLQAAEAEAQRQGYQVQP